ncbi:uncharacterized protein PHACADRAFT_96286, partial [Phanerochaete carnosa HHB-10118-sp]
QKSQTLQNGKLRHCLKCMRYGACTEADIKLLHSCVVGRGPNQPKLPNQKFHQILIITSWNAHRDKINKIRSEQFANELDQKLTSFYSSNEINSFLKDALWDLHHFCTQNHSELLKICIRLSIMVKKNIATECCATNRAEARVVGWKCNSLDKTGKLVLETVFIELTSPSTFIQLDGLLLNVVFMHCAQISVKCIMPNGKILQISRDQIPLIPNFAMIDYNLQHHTKSYNVVDLNNCRNHQSIYICLSREFSYESIAIIQGFDNKKIRSGIPG